MTERVGQDAYRARQPHGRLHSQLDFGSFSQETKIEGREVMRINPDEARMRHIKNNDLAKVFHDRGAFLAAAQLTTDLRPGVVQVSTGAWYDPVASPDEPDGICVNGDNPNAVTRDIGTSQLAQGCTGPLSLVQVEKFEGTWPPGRGYHPPRLRLGDLE